MPLPFIGQIKLSAVNFVRENYLPCDGSILNIADYKALFSIIGNDFGGDGKTTFAVPDLRGAVTIGVGTNESSGKEYTTNEIEGNESITITAAQMPAHNHTATGVVQATLMVNNTAANRFEPDLTDCIAAFNTKNDQGVIGQTVNGYNTASPNLALNKGTINIATKNDPQNATLPPVLSNTGNGKPLNIMQPYLPLTYMIAYTGIYGPTYIPGDDENN
ncbi:MAG: phage tail protein [Chitinophagaceae bacterium]